jgi:hypothetical protein
LCPGLAGNEWIAFAQRDGVPAAEFFLSLQFASGMSDIRAMLQQALKVFMETTNRRMAPGAEARAYADGAPLYQARANAIRSKGAAGQYP